ncbi:hypothetical protein ACFRI7_19115 [Streptomyces sp. NPDC056716]|uniref:hypothetical protein n=1 Tax=unclassified Streptomyces TaxID=2593676 RepID=UPI003686A931
MLGHFGADIAPYRLRAVAADGGQVRRGPGWGLVGGRGTAGGGVAVALAGRLDIRLPLLSRIEAAGGAVADRNQAAVLKGAYEADGTGFAARLDGSYAVAVVDTRAAPAVVLATDDAGTTPLYYHWDPGRELLLFATAIPDLLALLPHRPALWEPGPDAYLTVGAPLDGETLIDGVRSLPPGTTAVCTRAEGLRLIRRGTALPGRPAPSTAAAQPAPPCVDCLPDTLRHLPDLLPALAWSLGQPDPDPAALTSYALYASAHRAGLRSAPAADTVDEIVRGRGRVEAADGGAADGIARYVDTLGPVPARARFGLYSSDYRAYLADRGDTALRLTERLGEQAVRGTRRTALTGFELDVLLPARGLRRTAHLSGAHEVRATLPGGPRRTWSAATTAVPEWYRTARRTTSARTLLAHDTALTGLVREVLSAERLRRAGMFDAGAVRRLLDAQLTHPCDRLAGTVWALLMFELWREEYAVTPHRTARSAVLARTPADLPALGHRTVAI